MRRTFGVAVATCVAIASVTPSAWAVCRVVQPSEESGANPVTFDPTTTVLYVSAPDQLVDYLCPEQPQDTGVSAAMGEIILPGLAVGSEGASEGVHAGDSGLAQPNPYFDIGQIRWAYEWDIDDPSTCSDGSAAEPVLDNLIHAVIRPAIYASGGSAGLIMPLPARADVHLAPRGILEEVANLRTADVVEVVTYIEDESLGAQCSDPHYSSLGPVETIWRAPGAVMGCEIDESSGSDDSYYRPGLENADTETWTAQGSDGNDGAEGGVVEFETIPTSADYDVTVLNASSLDALTAWLDENQFAHTEIDDLAFSHYVSEGAWFMAVHVHPQDASGARVGLEPLVVTWRGAEIQIQNRLTYQPLGGSLVNDTFILARSGMIPANGRGTTTFRGATYTDGGQIGRFGLSDGYLTRVEMARDTSEDLEDSRFVPSYGEIRPELRRFTTVRIAAACCPDNSVLRTSREFQRRYTYVEGSQAAGGEFFSSPLPTAQECQMDTAEYEAWGGSSSASDDSSASDSQCGSCAFAVADHVSAAAGWAPWLLALVFLRQSARRRRLRESSDVQHPGR